MRRGFGHALEASKYFLKTGKEQLGRSGGGSEDKNGKGIEWGQCGRGAEGGGGGGGGEGGGGLGTQRWGRWGR